MRKHYVKKHREVEGNKRHEAKIEKIHAHTPGTLVLSLKIAQLSLNDRSHTENNTRERVKEMNQTRRNCRKNEPRSRSTLTFLCTTAYFFS